MVVSKLRYLERRYHSQQKLLEAINTKVSQKLSGADLSRYLSGKAHPSGKRLDELWDLLLSNYFKELQFRNIIKKHSHIIEIDNNLQIDVSYLLSDARALYTIIDFALYRKLYSVDGREVILAECGINKIATLEVDGIAFAAAIAASMGQNVDMVYCRKSPTFDFLERSEWGQSMFKPADGRLQGLFLPKKYIKDGERVLIVDDVVNSGSSIRALIKLVSNLKGIPVAVLVLYSHMKDYTSILNDFPDLKFIVLYNQ